MAELASGLRAFLRGLVPEAHAEQGQGLWRVPRAEARAAHKCMAPAQGRHSHQLSERSGSDLNTEVVVPAF